MENRSPSTFHALCLSLKDWHVLLGFPNRYRGCHRGLYLLRSVPNCFVCKVGTGSTSLALRHSYSLTRCLGRSEHCDPRRDLLFKLSLAEIVEFGIRDSIWGTFAWFRKHLINIGAEADFIKIFVLNSHKDKGGKKTASRTTRLPRLFIMIRLSKVRRICCYKTIFSYISFTFCHGFAVVPCNSGRNL